MVIDGYSAANSHNALTMSVATISILPEKYAKPILVSALFDTGVAATIAHPSILSKEYWRPYHRVFKVANGESFEYQTSLSALLKKNAPTWNQAQAHCVKTLKSLCSKLPPLHIPTNEGLLILQTDASDQFQLFGYIRNCIIAAIPEHQQRLFKMLR
ncbi:hypothetical protein ACLOJK_012282 [Asimina triloba]